MIISKKEKANVTGISAKRKIASVICIFLIAIMVISPLVMSVGIHSHDTEAVVEDTTSEN